MANIRKELKPYIPHLIYHKVESVPRYVRTGNILKIGLRRTTDDYTILSGLCTHIRNRHYNSTFTIRVNVVGAGLEITCPLYSPSVRFLGLIKENKTKRSKIDKSTAPSL